MQTTTPTLIPFPLRGCARHRIKPRQRIVSLIARITRKTKPKLKATPEQLRALQKKHGKE